MYKRQQENYPLVHQYGLVEKTKEYNLENAAKGYLPQFALSADVYKRQALNLLCEYAFDFLSLTQLYAHVAVDNDVCMKLFTSCGCVQCGLLKNWLQIGGCYKDAALFQCLNPKLNCK